MRLTPLNNLGNIREALFFTFISLLLYFLPTENAYALVRSDFSGVSGALGAFKLFIIEVDTKVATMLGGGTDIEFA